MPGAVGGDGRAAITALVEELQAGVCGAAESLEREAAARDSRLTARTFAADDWQRDGANGTLGGWGSSRGRGLGKSWRSSRDDAANRAACQIATLRAWKTIS